MQQRQLGQQGLRLSERVNISLRIMAWRLSLVRSSRPSAMTRSASRMPLPPSEPKARSRD